MKMRYIMIFLILTACVFGSYYAGGSGTSSSPFQIANKTNLLHLMNDDDPNWASGVYFIVTADIDLDDDATCSPIGTSTTPFAGDFDGNGKTITDFSYTAAAYTGGGFFGYTGPEANIYDLTLASPSLNYYKYGGAFVGYNWGDINNCHVSACTVTADYDTHPDWLSYIGGFCGLNVGRILYSTVTGVSAVSNDGMRAGGFTGGNGYRETESVYIPLGVIYQCSTTASVTATNPTAANGESGGFCGQNVGRLLSCHSSGNVEIYCTHNDASPGTASVGGFCGHTSGGVISHCYSEGNISGINDNTYYVSTIGGFLGEATFGGTEVNYCYSTGSVDANSTDTYAKVGGFIGLATNVTIDHCYCTGAVNTVGSNGTMDYVGGFAGQITTSGSFPTSVTDCYSQSATVNGDSYVGGFVGWIQAGCTVTRCYSFAAVTANSNNDAFVGVNAGTITGSYWNSTTSGDASDTASGTEPLTTAQFKVSSNFTDWTFSTSEWYTVGDTAYPAFYFQRRGAF